MNCQPTVVAALSTLAVCGLGTWLWLPATAPAPPADGPAAAILGGRGQELLEARLGGTLEAFIAEQRRRAKPGGSAVERRWLAEALYERVLGRDALKGLRVGGLIGADSWTANRRDIEEALALVEKAREAGDDSAANHRLEACLLTCTLKDLGSVLATQGRIGTALETALERDPRNGEAHLAVGCRHLFVPSWLGQDLDKALEHLHFAADALPGNERPAIFTAFAHHLRGDCGACLEWLDEAGRRNPNNAFVREVRRRLDRSEDEAFERDIPAPGS